MLWDFGRKSTALGRPMVFDDRTLLDFEYGNGFG